MDRTSKRLSRALVLDRSIEFLAKVNDEEQRDREKALDQRMSVQRFHTSESLESLVKSHDNVPPPDRGSKALMFMISAFIIEAIMWGMLILFHSDFIWFFGPAVEFYSGADSWMSCKLSLVVLQKS
jgi:hypothetical protein